MKKILNTLFLTLFLYLLLFSKITFGQTGQLIRIIENGKYGYINQKGEVKIKPQFSNAQDFWNGIAAVRHNGLYGFIDETGKFIIQPKYDYASIFSDRMLAIHQNNGTIKAINKKEETIFDFDFERVYSYLTLVTSASQKAIMATKSRKQGLMDLTTKKFLIDTVQRYEINYFRDGLAVMTKSSGKLEKNIYKKAYAVIDTLGKYIVDFGVYEKIDNFVNGYAKVELLSKVNKKQLLQGVINTKGKLLFQREKDEQNYIDGDFYDGLARINLQKSKTEYQGFINLKGEIVLNDTLIREVGDFSNERVFIKDREAGWFLINDKCKIISKDTFQDVFKQKFIKGYAIVEQDNWGIIDINGNFVIKPIYDIAQVEIMDNMFLYKEADSGKDDLYGIRDLKDNVIVQPIIQKFDRIGFYNGLLRTSINNRVTYINKLGDIVWQQKTDTNQVLKKVNRESVDNSHFPVTSLGNNKKENLHTINNEKIFLYIDINRRDTIENKYFGFKTYIINPTKDTISLISSIFRPYVSVQAKNAKEEWKSIKFANRYYTSPDGKSDVKLPAHSHLKFTIPDYDGSFKTKIRVEYKYSERTKSKKNPKEKIIYSNEIDANINISQFWLQDYWLPGDILDFLDPY